MKRLSFVLFAFVLTLTLCAQLPVADGYYRVRNTKTGRYVTLIDDYGKIDYNATDVDAGAIRTYRLTGTNAQWDNEKVISNPASVLYSQCYSTTNNQYDFFCQGVSTYSITGYHLNLLYRNGAYRLYASQGGLTKYLNDSPNNDADSSYVETTGDTKDWDALPISADGECYFGMLPTISCGGAYYLSFFADFPFSFHSEGMKAYYVSKVDALYKVAVWNEITSEDIPAVTPIFVECSSDKPTNNRLDIHKSNVPGLTDNLLKGVYFCNIKTQKVNPHFDVVENNPETMRVLGVLSDGKIGLKKYGGMYFPKNTAYIIVPEGMPDEIRLVTEEEYEEMQDLVFAESISLDKTSASVAIGESVQLTATVLPEDAFDKDVAWFSSDEDVATVSDDGLVTAISKGNATITATTLDGTFLSASCEITVTSPYVEYIFINEEDFELKAGESKQLSVTILPESAKNKEVTWKSSDTSIATVSNKGLVKAIAAGDAVITATTKDGTNLSATINVKVSTIPVESITLNYNTYSVDLSLTKTFRLYATVLPSNASNKTLSWNSSDTNVATVNKDGLVTVKKEGFAIITAKATDGSGCKAQCNLTSTDAINDVSAKTINSDSAVRYNISGQQVGQDYKGIVIINGKKYISK